ncbi:hypothetical protein BpHYR1_052896 [Brachionus plicatilis]|uniref:Uncharacterized protein n=1 Tax=Brachionus plicatilis TaxID=10195 RepID=A0A3M7RRL0_BRAPC|nr:hypothetical protein BpHYR1_052896 [Brachionus plicatilis]
MQQEPVNHICHRKKFPSLNQFDSDWEKSASKISFDFWSHIMSNNVTLKDSMKFFEKCEELTSRDELNKYVTLK